MALQNRVTPDGNLIAENWRGDFMGNRGGKIHDPGTKTLLKRKWASKRWIICVTEFKNRQRQIMGSGYTELFFLDEVSALAAGHRPCFECQRDRANSYAELWPGTGRRASADEMDAALHQERCETSLNPFLEDVSTLPDGSMIKDSEGSIFALKGSKMLKWSGYGYQMGDRTVGEISLITPPSTLNVLRRGFKPTWHKSAALTEQ